MVKALAIDIGTSSVRTAIVDTFGAVSHVHQRRFTISAPSPGEIELDAVEIAEFTLELARQTLYEGGGCDVVGITNQRATTIVFDPLTGRPVGPALGWQDLRTVIDCLVLQGDGLRLAPNQSATKARWLVAQSGRAPSELRFATIETWIAWHLTRGMTHITDRSNAAITGLVLASVDAWDERILEVLDLDLAMMPRIVDTMGSFGAAVALEGSPQITALVGDQPASLFGQSCITSGAKITFGTGAMLDMVRGTVGPVEMTRFTSGCFPVILRSQDEVATWGIEGIVLSAGACIDWLRDDLGLITDVAETNALAASVDSSDGVEFVPAHSGLGTPYWDFGARSGFFGITRGSTKAHLVRAVLEGIAQRGADLVDAAELETGTRLSELRIDGGMSDNDFFVARLADFTGLRVTVSPEREATTRGAGLMALVSAGALDFDDVERMWSPTKVFEPTLSAPQRQESRDHWFASVQRAARTIPELSDVQF
ncbi:MAG: glycerol kinase [Acidimicrobiaceae bacterium]|nr:glycerol kinase [Acidimicrobiaceae bacterium]